jgi:hypothetical protein
MAITKTCKSCGESKIGSAFPKDRNTCRSCYAGNQRVRYECENNRRISKLLRWPVIAVIIGTLSYEYVSGHNRICVYDSVHGQFAITIDAMRVCPLTMEIDE